MANRIGYFLIFIEGFIGLSVQILTLRQLSPFVGNSVIITSVIIAIFLLFLALGYKRGGQYVINYEKVLIKNFTLLVLYVGVGLSYFVVDIVFYYLQIYWHCSLFVSLIIYLLLFTAPVAYILGQTLPITMNLVQPYQTVGAMGGNILNVNTLGACLGALTSVLLLQYCGVALTIFIIVCLAVLAVMVLRLRTSGWLPYALLVFGLVIVYIFNINLERALFTKTNAYANYRVVHEPDAVQLQINNSLASQLTPGKEGCAYIELVKRILFKDLKLHNKDILVLGAGAFTLSAQNTYDNRFLYVDIDKTLPDIIAKQFPNAPLEQFVVSDARAFIRATSNHYDAIFIDVYSGPRTVPAHLLTSEFMNEIQNKLNPEGVVILNMIASPFLKDDFSRRLDLTIRDSFQRCMSIPLNYSEDFNNIIYVCKAPISTTNNKPYHDNHSKVTFDLFQSFNDK